MDFSGNATLKLDPKGRIFLPKRFVEYEDDADPGTRRVIQHFWLVPGLDGCLWLLDHNEWRRMQRRLKAMEIGDRRLRAMQRFVFSNAEKLKPDSQGRVTLPEKLRQKVGIGTEACVIGVGRRIEIWAPDVYAKATSEAEANWMDDLEAVLGGEGGLP
ncbi:MAG: division/cell wall cluster transcriptional repressor MraZ [Planctomycetota bacterium]